MTGIEKFEPPTRNLITSLYIPGCLFSMPVQDSIILIDFRISELKPFTHDQLYLKPSENSWSIGQVYMRLIETTGYYLNEARICSSNDKQAQREMNGEGKEMFRNDGFTDMEIAGPSSNQRTPQPISRE